MSSWLTLDWWLNLKWVHIHVWCVLNMLCTCTTSQLRTSCKPAVGHLHMQLQVCTSMACLCTSMACLCTCTSMACVCTCTSMACVYIDELMVHSLFDLHVQHVCANDDIRTYECAHPYMSRELYRCKTSMVWLSTALCGSCLLWPITNIYFCTLGILSAHQPHPTSLYHCLHWISIHVHARHVDVVTTHTMPTPHRLSYLWTPYILRHITCTVNT